MIAAIIFDFDGVITQSNYIRRNAYYDIFNHVPVSREVIKEIVTEAIIEDLKRNRYGIIEATLQKLRDKGLMHFQDLRRETEKYVNMYNEVTEREVSRVQEVPGATNALKILSQKYSLFVITGTLQKSLDIVMRNRDLVKYFKKAYGDYRDKIDGIKILLQEQGVTPKKLVYVGDGNSDYECAKQFGMIFVGIINETNDFEKKEDIKWKLYDLEKLPEIIGEIEKSF